MRGGWNWLRSVSSGGLRISSVKTCYLHMATALQPLRVTGASRMTDKAKFPSLDRKYPHYVTPHRGTDQR